MRVAESASEESKLQFLHRAASRPKIPSICLQEAEQCLQGNNHACYPDEQGKNLVQHESCGKAAQAQHGI